MPRPATPIGQLTGREADIARLMARGYTNGQIAEELGITFATAKWHVSQVIGKLDASSREEAAAIWANEQRGSVRFRRALATLGSGATIRRLALGAGAIAGAGVLAAAALFIINQDSGEPASPGDETPAAVATDTPGPTATPTVLAAAGPCSDENLVNGFLVIAEGETPPDCTGLASGTPIVPVPPDGKRYELALPPGPWRQENFDAVTLASGISVSGARYFNNQTGAPAFAVYHHTWFGAPGRVVEGANPRPSGDLPGPGIVVDRLHPTEAMVPGTDGTLGPPSTAAYWSEGEATFSVEVFEGSGANLTLEQVIPLLVFFNSQESRADYWDPGSGDFVQQPPWLYPADVETGIDFINTVIQRAAAGEGSLADLADTALVPCVESPDVSIRVPAVCPDGAAPGTPVPAFLMGGCPGDWFGLDPLNNADILENAIFQQAWLYAIAEVEDADPGGLEYVAAFTTGERTLSVALTASGVAGVGGGGSCPTPELANWAPTVDSWLLPPLYPLPN